MRKNLFLSTAVDFYQIFTLTFNIKFQVSLKFFDVLQNFYFYRFWSEFDQISKKIIFVKLVTLFDQISAKNEENKKSPKHSKNSNKT